MERRISCQKLLHCFYKELGLRMNKSDYFMKHISKASFETAFTYGLEDIFLREVVMRRELWPNKMTLTTYDKVEESNK